jgi:hypothetical protein
MHHAHEHGIVHRDLKPANVLLASGKSKEIGPAADIYSLGALLYECLTGRPPFKAASTLDTVMQVLHNEPVPPTQLQPRTPRDLETICLKCLQKDPRKRYASAAELADDLHRFQTGLPIVARPVGSFERTVKWVHRQPVLTGLIVALVVGTAVSTYFALEASRLAREANASAATAREKEGEARDREMDAVQAREQARNREREAIDAREQAESTLVRSLLRPLGHLEGGTLNEMEIEALWELAESPGERVRLLFFENALRRPGTSQQLRKRCEYAVQAAVGLNRDRRRKLEELLLKHARDPGLDPRTREDIVYAGVALGNRSPELAREAARVLVKAVGQTDDPTLLYNLLATLNTVLERLEPEETEEYAGAAARALEEAFRRANDTTSLAGLAQGFAWLPDDLDAAEAERLAAAAARRLVEVMGEVTDPQTLNALAQALVVVLDKLPPAEASRQAAATARLLLAVVDKTNDYPGLMSLGSSLQGLSGKLGREEAAAAVRAVATIMGKSAHPNVHLFCCQALQALADDLPRAEAARQAEVLGRTLVDAMARTNEFSYLWTQAQGFKLVAPLMKPEEASRQAEAAARLLVEQLARAPDGAQASFVCSSLLCLVDALEGEAVRFTARALVKALSEGNDPSLLASLCGALTALAAKLDAEAAAETGRALAAAMGKGVAPTTLGNLVETWLAAAGQMDPVESARQADEPARLLVEALGKTYDPALHQTLVGHLKGVLSRQGPAEASRRASEAARLLLGHMARMNKPANLNAFAAGWAQLADHLPPAEAGPQAAEAARLLTDALARAPDSTAVEALCGGLKTVTDRLGPDEAAAAARVLVGAIEQSTDCPAMRPLALGLLAVSQRAGEADSPDVRRALTAALAKASEPDAIVAGWLQAGQAEWLRREPGEVDRRSALLARSAGLGLTPRCPFTTLPTLLEATRPAPGPFSTQQLVDLLKLPTCVGIARDVILQELGQRHHRTFPDLWDFVDYAHQHLPEVDLHSPPGRLKK